MESDQISLKAIHQIIHILGGNRRIDHEICRNPGSRWVACEWGNDGGIIEREKRKISPDVVRGRVWPDYVFEPAGSDLIIIGGVTPATEAVTWIIIEDIGMVDVLRV